MAHQSKKIKIRSTNESWLLVEKFIDEICERYYIANRYYGNILIAVEEAVRNAMIHGNKGNADKLISLAFRPHRNGISILVEDQGEGFDFATVQNPVESENKAGNGIYLMRTLADQVRYNNKGNRVELFFDISSINQETSISRKRLLNNYFQKTGSFAKKT